MANTFFIANISCADIANGKRFEYRCTSFNTIIYEYFKTNFRIVKTYNDQEFKDKYLNFTKRQLKNELKCLSKENTDRNAIVYVSKLLRSKVQPKPNANMDNINHDEEVSKNFWSYCKCFIDCPKKVLATFNKTTCNKYFKKAFSCTNPLKVFTIPNWIDPFPQPTSPFNTSPPTYCEINKIVKRMKSSGSPCPLD